MLSVILAQCRWMVVRSRGLLFSYSNDYYLSRLRELLRAEPRWVHGHLEFVRYLLHSLQSTADHLTRQQYDEINNSLAAVDLLTANGVTLRRCRQRELHALQERFEAISSFDQPTLTARKNVS